MDLSRCSYEQAYNMECNIFGLTQFDNMTSFFGEKHYFPQGAGYAVVLAGGIFFALFTNALVWLDEKFGGSVYDNAHFNTAGRSIRTGLVCVDAISHWSWNSVFLFVPTLYWYYGWFAVLGSSVGGSVAIFLFGIVGLELKQKAPSATTIMQVVRKRWGTPAHVVFLFLMLLTNWFVTVTNILGGCQVISAMTGINIYAASILVPFGIILFSAFGGLKATFTSSYMLTCVIVICMMIFAFRFFTVDGLNGNMGSLRRIFENTQTMSLVKPVTAFAGLAGNRHGSYLTFFSVQGFCYMINNLTANAPLVFNDQAYWQTSVAGKAMSVVKGYALSGVLWFPINYLFAITLGGAAVALDLPISSDEASNSLVVPATAIVLLGKTGGALVIVIIFMATTSAVSAELVGVSSLLTYDLWQLYLRPQASPRELLMVSRAGVCLWGFVGALSVCIVVLLSFNFNWFILVIGVFTPASVPALFCVLFWDRVSSWNAIFSAVFGTLCSVFVWLYVAYRKVGEVSIDSTEQTLPITASTVAALGAATLAIVLWAWILPVKFDWEELKQINVEDLHAEGISADATKVDQEALQKAKKVATYLAIAFSFVTCVAWPLLAFPAGDWSYHYFAFNVILAIIWGLISTVVLCLMPLVESRREITAIMHNLVTWQPAGKRSLLATTHKPEADFKADAIGDATNVKPGVYNIGGATDMVHMLDDSAHAGTAAQAAMKL